MIAESADFDRWIAPARLVDLPGGAQAAVRSAQLVDGGRSIVPRADAVVAPRPDGDAALDLALELASAEASPPARPALLAPISDVAWNPERPYADSEFPSRELRLLGLFRYATAVRHFFGYPQLLGADWERAVLEAIPALEDAKDALAYQLALRRLLHRLPDGHVFLYGAKALDHLLGVPASARTAIVEGRLGVIWVAPGQRAEDARAGDEVVLLDGQPIAERLAWLYQISRGSSERARREYAAERALFGGDGTSAAVELRGQDGRMRRAYLARSGRFWAEFPQTGEAVQLKEGNIGYVDLRRLALDEVPAAAAKLQSTRGLIVDLRGYPRGGAWPLSGWLNSRGARAGSIYLRPGILSGVVVDGDRVEDSLLQFMQPIPPSPLAATYAGKVAVLIDSQAMSQSEHSCLFLEASI